MDKTTIEISKFEQIFPKIDKWDKKVSLNLYKHFDPKSKSGEHWAKYLSFAGDPRWWGVVIPILFVYGLIIKDLSLLIIFLTGFVQSYAIYYIIKNFFKRPRPFVQIEEINRKDKTGHGYSFPSGHTHHTTILLGLFWFNFYPHSWFAILILLYLGAVGFSRILVGVHFPSDIVVALIEGICVLILYWFFTKNLYLNIYNWFISISNFWSFF